MSQMDSDNFVPIWAVACMEDIKALTADVDLIVDVLRGNNGGWQFISFVVLKSFHGSRHHFNKKFHF